MILTGLLAAAVTLETAAATAPVRRVFPPSQRYTLALPLHWQDRYDWNSPEPGLEAGSPEGRCTVGLRFYPQGQSEFASSEEYIGRQRILMSEADRARPVGTARVAGRAAKEFRQTVTLSPPKEKQAPPLTLLQIRIVLQAEDGFFVFMLDAQPGSEAEGEKVFRSMVRSFKLKPAKKAPKGTLRPAGP